MKLNLRPAQPVPIKEPPEIRYILHASEDWRSIALGADKSLEGAIAKARSRSGVTYIYRYEINNDEFETLVTPVLVQTVYR